MALNYNLGAGFNKKPGYINVDSSKVTQPDIHADIRRVPWKWAESDSADLILTDNLAEHIERYTWIKVVRECHRVLKNGGIFVIKAPVLAADNLDACFSDPTHINFFTMQSSDYYFHQHPRWMHFGRVYGIPPFDRIENRRSGRFIIIKLKAIK